MNSVAQKLLQGYCQYRICRISYKVSIRQGGLADTTVLETEVKNIISDLQNSKIDVGKFLKHLQNIETDPDANSFIIT